MFYEPLTPGVECGLRRYPKGRYGRSGNMIRDTNTLIATCLTFIHQLEYGKYNDPYAYSDVVQKKEYDTKVDEIVKTIKSVFKLWMKENEL